MGGETTHTTINVDWQQTSTVISQHQTTTTSQARVSIVRTTPTQATSELQEESADIRITPFEGGETGSENESTHDSPLEGGETNTEDEDLKYWRRIRMLYNNRDSTDDSHSSSLYTHKKGRKKKQGTGVTPDPICQRKSPPYGNRRVRERPRQTGTDHQREGSLPRPDSRARSNSNASESEDGRELWEQFMAMLDRWDTGNSDEEAVETNSDERELWERYVATAEIHSDEEIRATQIERMRNSSHWSRALEAEMLGLIGGMRTPESISVSDNETGPRSDNETIIPRMTLRRTTRMSDCTTPSTPIEVVQGGCGTWVRSPLGTPARNAVLLTPPRVTRANDDPQQNENLPMGAEEEQDCNVWACSANAGCERLQQLLAQSGETLRRIFRRPNQS